MFEEYLGISTDYVVIGMAAVILLLIILMIINVVQMSKLKKRYAIFMSGKNAKSLEDTLVYRLEQVDELIENNAANERNIDALFKFGFQKYGLIKYDAFQEMGGKLSFSLAMLNEKNDGFVLNAVHSREGCYTYVKEIIDGNSIITLAEEEQQALDAALESNK